VSMSERMSFIHRSPGTLACPILSAWGCKAPTAVPSSPFVARRGCKNYT
jgi:hypothetical protein